MSEPSKVNSSSAFFPFWRFQSNWPCYTETNGFTFFTPKSGGENKGTYFFAPAFIFFLTRQYLELLNCGVLEKEVNGYLANFLSESIEFFQYEEQLVTRVFILLLQNSSTIFPSNHIIIWFGGFFERLWLFAFSLQKLKLWFDGIFLHHEYCWNPRWVRSKKCSSSR